MGLQLTDIPNEVLDHVISFCEDSRNGRSWENSRFSSPYTKLLFRLLLVCRKWYQLVLPRLYRIIRSSGPGIPNANTRLGLGLGPSAEGRYISTLIAILKGGNGRLARLVKEVDVVVSDGVLNRLESSLYMDMLGVCRSGLQRIVLLNLDGDQASEFANVLRSMPPTLLSLHASVTTEELYDVRGAVESVDALLSIMGRWVNLESIDCHCGSPFDDSEEEYHQYGAELLQVNGSSDNGTRYYSPLKLNALHTVRIGPADMNFEQLRLLAEMAPNIAILDVFLDPDVQSVEVVSCLRAWSDSMTSLTLTGLVGSIDEVVCNFSKLEEIGIPATAISPQSLSSLQHLKTLRYMKVTKSVVNTLIEELSKPLSFVALSNIILDEAISLNAEITFDLIDACTYRKIRLEIHKKGGTGTYLLEHTSY